MSYTSQTLYISSQTFVNNLAANLTAAAQGAYRKRILGLQLRRAKRKRGQLKPQIRRISIAVYPRQRCERCARAQLSRNVAARLNTSLAGVESSVSTQK